MVLEEERGTIVSSRTVQSELKKSGLRSCIAFLKPLLSKKNVADRLDNCSKWFNWPKAAWDSVIFSDDCKFNLFYSDSIQRVWRKPGYRYESKTLRPIVKYGGGNVIA
jgi:hypothetical protein